MRGLFSNLPLIRLDRSDKPCKLAPTALLWVGATFLSVLSGCNAPYQRSSGEEIRVKQIAWSPSRDIAVSTENLSLTIVDRDGGLRSTINQVSGVSGWNSTGSRLLYKESLGAGASPGATLGQLRIYDKVSAAGTPLNRDPLNIGQSCFVGDDAVAFINLSVSTTGHTKNSLETISLSGKSLNSYPAPIDLIPWRLAYDEPSRRILASVEVLQAPKPPARFYYIITGGNFTVVPGTYGYSPYFAFDKRHSVIAAAALDSAEHLRRIDLFRLNDAVPQAQPLLQEKNFPKSCLLDSMSFSDDGDKLAIAAAPRDSVPQIYLYDFRTGGLTTIVQGTQPCFSPDGRRIAFVEDGSFPHANGPRVLTCNLDGSDVTRIFGPPQGLGVVVKASLLILCAGGVWIIYVLIVRRRAKTTS